MPNVISPETTARAAKKGDQDIRGLVECLFAEVLDGIAATVVLRDHAQARGTAVGGFELVGMGECIEHFI